MQRHGRTLKRLLVGLVAVVISLDVFDTLSTAPGSSGTAFRVLLAVGAVLTLSLGLVLGVTDQPAYAVGAVVASPLVALYALTGLLLPWDQVAYVAGQSTLELLLAVPVVGEPLATALFGGVTLSGASLRRAARLHGALLVVWVVGFVAVVGPALYRRALR